MIPVKYNSATASAKHKIYMLKLKINKKDKIENTIEETIIKSNTCFFESPLARRYI